MTFRCSLPAELSSQKLHEQTVSVRTSYRPRTRPINSFMQFRWKYGGRNVFSATDQRGGKTTKSTAAVPGLVVGQVSTATRKRTILDQVQKEARWLWPKPIIPVEPVNIESCRLGSPTIERYTCEPSAALLAVRNSATGRAYGPSNAPVKMEGSMWSKATALTGQNFARLYCNTGTIVRPAEGQVRKVMMLSCKLQAKIQETLIDARDLNLED